MHEEDEYYIDDDGYRRALLTRSELQETLFEVQFVCQTIAQVMDRLEKDFESMDKRLTKLENRKRRVGENDYEHY